MCYMFGMGGCTNCKAKPGCDDRKGSMFETMERALERLYPSRVWGHPDDRARAGAGLDADELHGLADELAAELDASAFVREGAEDEYCDYIYLLCIGREPCLVQLRDLAAPIPDELEGVAVNEQYLRLCVSTMAPVAGVQQVAMDLSWDPDGPVVRESPRPGVYDAPLLHRLQRLVALLPAYELVHVDFGEICAPLEGYRVGDYPRLYGGEPVAANYLFYPQPVTTRTTTAL